VPGESVVGAGAVNECTSSLGRSSCEVAASIPGRIEHQSAAASQRIGLNPGKARKFHHSRASDLVDVGLYASPRTPEVDLTIAVIAVVTFGCEPAVDVVAIAEQKPAGVGSLLPNPISIGIFREEPRPLDADFGLRFLRNRGWDA
jgi:hypothetical protein